LSFLALDMLNTEDGYTSGLSLGKKQGGLYTTNGQNWTESTEKHLFGAFQCVGEVSDEFLFQIGQWGGVSKGDDGDGLQISTDGGVTFTSYSWNQTYPARYGSFINANTGWISGGNFPSNESTTDVYKFNQHLSIDKRTGEYRLHPPFRGFNSGAYNYSTGTWGAVLAVTNDGGNSFTTLYQNNGNAEYGFYFNSVQFVDANNGWVVGEGVDNTTGEGYSFIWGTTDGGKNWETQLTLLGGSLTEVSMSSSTFGWAVGGINIGELSMQGVYYQTTDGSTWTLAGEVKRTYQLAVSTVDENNAYSAGLDLEDLCGVYAYTS